MADKLKVQQRHAYTNHLCNWMECVLWKRHRTDDIGKCRVVFFFLHFWPWYNDRFIDSHTIYNYAPKAFLSATGL